MVSSNLWLCQFICEKKEMFSSFTIYCVPVQGLNFPMTPITTLATQLELEGESEASLGSSHLPYICNISHLPANIISPTFHTQSATPWKTFWRHQLWYYSRTRGRRRSVKLRHLFRLLARRRRPSGGFDPVIRSASKKEHLVAIFWQIYGRGCSSCHNSLWQTILIRSTPIDRVSPNKCFERRSPQLGRIILRGRSCVFLIIIRYFSFLR